MADIQNNLVDLTVVYSKLNAQLDENISRLNAGAVAVENYNKKITNVPSQFQKALVDIKQKTDAVATSTNSLIQAEKRANQERLKELQLQKQREVAVDKYNAQLAKEEAKLASASNAYNRLQAELNKLTNSYQNLAVRQAQGATLNKAEAEQMAYLEKRIQSHDKTLKSVDATMGKFGRNVGNYTNSFNPLSSAISRVAQEVPNLGQSFQIFAMSIGNNIAAVKDAITGIIDKNKELQANGEKTKGVLSQVFSSIFSWNTALYVGIALFIAYSKEIETFTKNLFGMSNVLDETSKQVSEGQKASIKQTKEEIKYNQNLISVLGAKSKNDKEKKIAFDELVNKYPYYLGHLKQEEYFLEKGRIAVAKLSDAIKDYNSSQVKRGVLVDLQMKKEAVLSEFISKMAEETHSHAQKKLDETNEQYIKRIARQHKLLSSMSASFIQSARDYIGVSSHVNKLEKEITQETINSIGILYKEQEAKKVKIKQLREIRDLEIDQADFMASDFKYQKTILENLIANNKKLSDDEKASLNDRLLAYSRYSEYKKRLVLLEYNGETKIIDKELADQKESINKAYNEQLKDIDNALKEKTTTTAIAGEKRAQAVKEKEEAIQALEKKIFIDRNLSYEQFVQKQKELTDEWNENVPQKISDALKRLKTNNTFSEEELQATKQYLQTLKEVTIASDFSVIEQENSDKMAKIRLDKLNSERNYYVQKLTQYDVDSEEYQNYANKIIAIDKQITDEQLKEQEKRNATIKKNQEFIKSFADDFKQNSGFSELFNLIDNFKTLKESGTATALAISEAFQEAFNTISESSQANFDREYERLAMQKEIALKFAGESSTAREEIERQAEEKRKAIARREAEAQKRLAIFNIAVNTAQAIIATLAKTPPPAGLPLAIGMGVIGAAQIAIVQSQQIPQFWKGTDNAPEGYAWTQEKGAEVITDKNGKVKTLGNNKGAQLTYLNKGDKVLNAEKSRDYINKTLINAGIQPMRSTIDNLQQNNSLTTDDFNAGISKLAKTMQSNKGSNTQVFLNNRQINTDYFKGKAV